MTIDAWQAIGQATNERQKMTDTQKIQWAIANAFLDCIIDSREFSFIN
jgi:hypothetical protein